MTKQIKVRVLPRSSRNEIIAFSEDEYKVKLVAAPVGGEANKKLIEFLSKQWRIPKSKIRIIRGLTSKNKILDLLD